MASRLRFGVSKNTTPVDLTKDSDDEHHALPRQSTESLLTLADNQDGEYEEEEETSPRRFIIIPDDNEDDDEVDDYAAEDEVIAVGHFSNHSRRSESPSRPAQARHLDSFVNSHGVQLTPGSGWELPDGDFFRIINIAQDRTSTTMNGRRFRHNFEINDMMPKCRNEIAAILQVPEGVAHPDIRDFLEQINPDDIAISREILVTNFPFSPWKKDSPYRHNDYSFRDDFLRKYPGRDLQEMRGYVCECERVVCRWKYIEHRDNSGKLLKEAAIMPITEHEADRTRRMSDVMKTKKWHGSYAELEGSMPADESALPTKKRKSKLDARAESIEETEIFGIKRTRRNSASGASIEEVEVEALYERRQGSLKLSAESSKRPNATQRGSKPLDTPTITFADICCGGGGWTRGATMAGMRPVWLLDHWNVACETVRRNWPDARILDWSIDKLCRRASRSWMRVVVLHISFPCQTYSGAHTSAGKMDEANSAAGYSVIPILQKTRPRVVTLEQTSGLLERHPASFRAMIHQFTASDYGIRWKIESANAHGNSHRRRRLIMIASCPGEPLPPFPKPTHGPPGSGLLPYPTIKDALRKARGTAEEYMYQHTVKDKPPYDPNRPLTQAVTCGGGEGDLHPSGKRSFNILELSILQGFQRFHKFVKATKTDLRRIIGNAVPSMLSEAVNKEVVKSIRERDKDLASYQASVISLDD